MKHTVISRLICIWKSALLGRVGVDWGCQEGKFWNFLAGKQESIFFNNSSRPCRTFVVISCVVVSGLGIFYLDFPE